MLVKMSYTTAVLVGILISILAINEVISITMALILALGVTLLIISVLQHIISRYEELCDAFAKEELLDQLLTKQSKKIIEAGNDEQKRRNARRLFDRFRRLGTLLGLRSLGRSYLAYLRGPIK